MRTFNIFMMIFLVPVLVASADEVKGFKARMKNLFKAKPVAASVKIDLDVEPSVAPSDDLTVDEVLYKRKDLKGQVIKLEFDRVNDLKQTKTGYTARVSFERMNRADGMVVMIPEAGFKFFEKKDEHSSADNDDVYIEVLGKNSVRAVGTRYSKSKPEGERYSW